MSTLTMTTPKQQQQQHNGPRLLLLSLATATTAATLTVGRYLLSETGDVLLLFADDSLQDECNVYYNGMDTDAIASSAEAMEEGDRQCWTTSATQGNLMNTIGQTLIALSTSPHLRSVPLLLIVISSTAFAIGIILTHSEVQQFYSWCTTHDLMECGTRCYNACVTVRNECEQQFVNATGAKNWNEAVDVVQNGLKRGKEVVGMKLEKTVECIDGLVMDDLLRMVVKVGSEVVLGVGGGIILYSIPEEVFPTVDDDDDGGEGVVVSTDVSGRMKNVRRRLIHAVDPTLDQILFRQGGLWDVMPSSWRDALIGLAAVKATMKTNCNDKVGTVDSPTADSTANEYDSNSLDDEETSSGDALVVSPPTHIHFDVKHEHNLPRDLSASTNGESIADALKATIHDLVVSHLKRNSKQQRSSTTGQTQDDQQLNQLQKPPASSPPPSQFERLLQGATIATTLSFFLHLRSSPSTRKAWGSAFHFLSSVGLLSTAVGASVASKLVSSASSNNIVGMKNPIIGMVCSKLLPSTLENVNDKLQRMVTRIKEEMKNNKRLQATLALTVLYGMKRLPRIRKR
eukprot:scaffold1468_cov206-Alexandrium_tamarense.AAC.5